MTQSALIFLVVAVVVYSCEAQEMERCRGGPHDVRVSCGSSCEPSCRQQEPMACAAVCIENACQCEQGFVRRESDQQCVPISQCRNIGRIGFYPNPIPPVPIIQFHYPIGSPQPQNNP